MRGPTIGRSLARFCVGHGGDESDAKRRVGVPSHEKCYAHNGACQTWQRIPSVSFKPPGSMYLDQFFTAKGALVFWPGDGNYHHGGPRKRSSTEVVYVANILTGNCKLFPCRPIFESSKEEITLTKIVIYTALQTYEVVLFVKTFHSDPQHLLFVTEFWVQIFDSTSCSWKNKNLVGRPNHNDWLVRRAVHSNGALYIVVGKSVTRLAAFDMEEETWTELSIGDGQNAIHGRSTEFNPKVVICDSNLFTICTERTVILGSYLFTRLLQVDLILGTLSIVTEGPPRVFIFKSGRVCCEPVPYDGCIYF